MPILTCVEKDADFAAWLRGHDWPVPLDIRHATPADASGDLIVWNMSQFPRPVEALLQGQPPGRMALVWDEPPPIEVQLQAMRLGAVAALTRSEQIDWLVVIRRFALDAESARASEAMLQSLLDRSYGQSVLAEVLQGIPSSQDLKALYAQAVRPLWEVAGAEWGQLRLPERALTVGEGPSGPSALPPGLADGPRPARVIAGERYVAYYPLVTSQRVGGLVIGGGVAQIHQLDAVEEVITAACGPIALGLANLQHLEDARRQAVLDGLTGLFHHAHFQALLRAEIDRVRRYGGEFALVLLDLDHFKAINDTHGHQTGDRALVATAGLLGETLRQSDVAARYGGEEFVLLLPSADADGALALAERLREALRAVPVPGPTGEPIGPLTASFGVALHEPGETAESVLRRADEALYAAKRGGRDRACLAPASRLSAGTVTAGA